MTDGYAARFNTVPYDASVERLLDGVLLHPSTATRARAGRRPGPGLEATVGGTPEAVTIAAGGGVIDDPTRGSYRFVIPTPVSINLDARPSAGASRIDLVVAKILDEDANPGDTLREVQIAVITGAAGASPAVPTVPSGQLQLARLDVPASGTVAVSKPAPRIAAAGGVVIVADSTERDAISPLYDGIVVYREDTDVLQARVNGAWRTIYAEGDMFTGAEGAFKGSAPAAGTRKIIKQGTIVATTNAAGGFAIPYHDGAFPNGVVSVVVTPGDNAAGFIFATTIYGNCDLNGWNGIAYKLSGSSVAAIVSQNIRANYVAVGW